MSVGIPKEVASLLTEFDLRHSLVASSGTKRRVQRASILVVKLNETVRSALEVVRSWRLSRDQEFKRHRPNIWICTFDSTVLRGEVEYLAHQAACPKGHLAPLG